MILNTMFIDGHREFRSTADHLKKRQLLKYEIIQWVLMNNLVINFNGYNAPTCFEIYMYLYTMLVYEKQIYIQKSYLYCRDRGTLQTRSPQQYPVGFSILYPGDPLPHQEGIPYPPPRYTLGISVDSTLETATSTLRGRMG